MEKQLNGSTEQSRSVPKLRFPEFKGEWEKKKLGEVAQIITGNTPPTSNQDYYNGEYLFVSPYDIDVSRWIKKTKTTLTKKGFEKGRKIRKGSTLFVCIGSTIGKICQIDNDCITNQQINSVISNKNDDDFIYSLLENHSPKIKMLAAEQAVPIINKTTFSNYVLSIPSLPEQSRIASFFSAIDEKLKLETQRMAALKQYKKGVMQKLFSQELRFKDENGEEFPDWEVKKLGEIAFKKSSNIAANTIEDNIGDFIIYGASGVLKKVDFYREEDEYISIVKDGAGVGRVFLCEAKSSVLGTLDIIKSIGGNLHYLFYFLQQTNFLTYVTGSTIPHIYFSDYKKEKIVFPCLNEQTKIANFLSAIDDKINRTENKIQQMQEYKKGLLQNLFI